MFDKLSVTQKIYLRINPRRIYFLKFLLEGYDGMAILSTVDARQGVVMVRFPREASTLLFDLLADLSAKISYKSLQ